MVRGGLTKGPNVYERKWFITVVKPTESATKCNMYIFSLNKDDCLWIFTIFLYLYNVFFALNLVSRPHSMGTFVNRPVVAGAALQTVCNSFAE